MFSTHSSLHLVTMATELGILRVDPVHFLPGAVVQRLITLFTELWISFNETNFSINRIVVEKMDNGINPLDNRGLGLNLIQLRKTTQ